MSAEYIVARDLNKDPYNLWQHLVASGRNLIGDRHILCGAEPTLGYLYRLLISFHLRSVKQVESFESPISEHASRTGQTWVPLM